MATPVAREDAASQAGGEVWNGISDEAERRALR